MCRATLVRHAAAAVVVARIYIKKSKKISDDHVCRHFTHSSLSLSKLSALCGKLNQRQDILFKICELAQICFMYTNSQKIPIPQLKDGICKKLLWYKWTFEQLNSFVLTLFQITSDLEKKNNRRTKLSTSTLFRPVVVMWCSYMGWFRPWPVEIGLKTLISAEHNGS